MPYLVNDFGGRYIEIARHPKVNKFLFSQTAFMANFFSNGSFGKIYQRRLR
jgi:hypothetical protein